MKTVLFLDSRQDRQRQLVTLLGHDYAVLTEATIEATKGAIARRGQIDVVIIGEYIGTATLGFVYELRRTGFPGALIGAIDDAKWRSDFEALLNCEVVTQLDELPSALSRVLTAKT